jgi:Dolichyl-phosphate-mannose-protein mannosyltransferase
MKVSPSHRSASFWIVGALALIAYLPGFWWGVPSATAPNRVHSWAVDAPMPVGPLAEMRGIVAPQPERTLGYPLMHDFVVFAAYLPYLAYVRLTGGLPVISGQYPYGLRDPVGTLKVLGLIAQFLSVLMATGIVLAAYDTAHTLWGRRTAILAALFALVCFPVFYYSRTGNVDVQVLFFTALAGAVFARIAAGGYSLSRAAWLGAFIGFALATKEPCFASFIGLPFVLLPLNRRAQNAGWLSWRLWKAPLLTGLIAFLAFGIGSGLFLAPERYFAHIAFARERIRLAAAGQIPSMQHYPNTWDGTLQYAMLLVRYLVDSLTLPGLVLALLGALWTLSKERLSATLLVMAGTYLAVLLFSTRTAQLRYLMPAAFTLALFEARAIAVAWETRIPAARFGSGLLACGILGIGALRGVDLTYAMIHDSRYAAGSWLAQQTQTGDRIEAFGPMVNLPHLKFGVVSTQAVRFWGFLKKPRLDTSAAAEIVEAWRERNPKFIIVMPDYTSAPAAPYSGSCPPEIYTGLVHGTLGYRKVAEFHTPPLLPWVGRPPLDYPTVNPPIEIFIRAEERSTL